MAGSAGEPPLPISTRDRADPFPLLQGTTTRHGRTMLPGQHELPLESTLGWSARQRWVVRFQFIGHDKRAPSKHLAEDRGRHVPCVTGELV